MAKTTAADIAHLIDSRLQHQAIRPAYRPFLLAYIASGYDQDGNRIQRAVEFEERIRTLECEDCRCSSQHGPECNDDLPRQAVSRHPRWQRRFGLETKGKTRPTPPRA